MPDVFIASDGPRVHPDHPTAALGCRGAVNFDLVCDLRHGAHHSGNWGGALADPAMILAQALATIVTPEGAITVPEWRPDPPRPLIRDLLSKIALDGGPEGPAVDAGWGEPGLTSAERVYAWNSFAVLALHAGQPEAPLNAIAPSARAHCQLSKLRRGFAQLAAPPTCACLKATGRWSLQTCNARELPSATGWIVAACVVRRRVLRRSDALGRLVPLPPAVDGTPPSTGSRGRAMAPGLPGSE